MPAMLAEDSLESSAFSLRDFGMGLSRETSLLMELLIRLLIVTALAAVTLPLFRSLADPAQEATDERPSETAFREGDRE